MIYRSAAVLNRCDSYFLMLLEGTLQLHHEGFRICHFKATALER